MNLQQTAAAIAKQLHADLKVGLKAINLSIVRERVALAADGLSDLEREHLETMVLRRVAEQAG